MLSSWQRQEQHPCLHVIAWQHVISFGVLSLIDPETNQVMRSDHPTIKALAGKLNVGDELKNFKLSESKVVNLTTGEENENLFWVEQV